MTAATANGSAAVSASGGGSRSGCSVNRVSGTGSGANHATSVNSANAAGSSSASRSNDTAHDAVTDRYGSSHAVIKAGGSACDQILQISLRRHAGVGQQVRGLVHRQRQVTQRLREPIRHGPGRPAAPRSSATDSARVNVATGSALAVPAPVRVP